jgi:hypothetical protein
LAKQFQRRFSKIGQSEQIWLPQTSLVSYWSISKTAFPLKPLGQMILVKLGKKHLWKILYRDYSFRFDPFTKSETKIACGHHVCKRIGTK